MELIENQEAYCPVCERKYIFGKDCPDFYTTCDHVSFWRGPVGGWRMRVAERKDRDTNQPPIDDRIRKERDAMPLYELSVAVDTRYAKLWDVLHRAYLQSAMGKGRDRHAPQGEAFTDQPICEMADFERYGPGGPLYQATKKCYEAFRAVRGMGRGSGDHTNVDRAVADMLGAIVYIAAAVVVVEGEMDGRNEQ